MDNALFINGVFEAVLDEIISSQERNPDVIAVVLQRANGKCELCGSGAPLSKASDGTPYLEVHPWINLSEGGEDAIENAGALCPNCHKQAHLGQHRDYIKSNKALPANAEKLRG
jgi:predicted HNH restriction endonuclease